ncbi:transcription initiation factor TFIID subunit 3 isoform X1 [Chrysoperla carnea]|uniref:transcription initiation factor TFIID subunit 3 isoform X1 n=1 Tax=Chrysoperla carnea TaxID=189513 RepID=UPI001D08073A|nr:transcription initiation factor TFIID subunit 3 isoform X1 [Chrysoperla carnea]
MDQYCKEVLKVVVAQICQTMGWHRIQSTPMEVMTDILSRYLRQMCVLTHKYSEHFGMTEPNLDHVALMMRDLHIQTHEIEEYINWVEPVPCNIVVPKLPVPREPQLNFLKPGSREVVTRPVHVHEHLPPMYPELEVEESSPIIASPGESPANSTTGTADLSKLASSPDALDVENVFKRPGDPISDSQLTKRPKLSFGEEGRPTREISSVMMTSSGFLSPAREGKLPEARTPQTLTESQQVASSQYPTVPPELRIEKKPKKVNENIKRKNSEFKGSELFKPDKINDSKTKKLPGMKENAKLKAFKTKQNLNANNTSMEIISAKTNLAAVQKQIPSDTKIQKVSTLVTKPIKIEDPPLQIFHRPQQMEPGITIIEIDDKGVRKLSNEPDKVKLNIFKKISSKSKDDKNDKFDKADKKSDNHFDFIAAASSRSGGDIHAVDIIPINEPIGGPTKMKAEKIEKSKTPEITIKEEPIYPSSLNRDRPPTPSVKHLLNTISDSDMSPPGTPSTPKTPELQTQLISPPPRKVEKERKKRKEKTKKIKAHKVKGVKMEPLTSPRRIKFNNTEITTSPAFTDRPKTPDDPITITSKSEINLPFQIQPPPIFPSIFPPFPSGPGLIPKTTTYSPFFPHNMGKHGFGQPPILSTNPLMSVTAIPTVKSEPPPEIRSPKQERDAPTNNNSFTVTPVVNNNSTIITKTIKNEPNELEITEISPVVVKSEKKSKEHKKDKKEKLEKKIRKKKDKKDKKKGKDKAEKKLEKEEKKLEKSEKIKIKKEKKEKHKDKQQQQQQQQIEAAVPKLTFKFSQPQRESTPDGQVSRKITIKTVMKKGTGGEDQAGGPNDREMSPELARISALVTHPPKSQKSLSVSLHHSSSSGQNQGQTIGAYATHGSNAPSPNFSENYNTEVSSFHTKIKKSMFKPIPKIKSKDLLKRVVPPTSVDESSDEDAKHAYMTTTIPQPPPAPHPAQQLPIKEAFYFDKDGNKVWICPACGGQDDGSPMIGCDDCDAWYHWVCVGIQVPPDDNEDWYCKVCLGKKQESFHTDKKKKRKKKEKKDH